MFYYWVYIINILWSSFFFYHWLFYFSCLFYSFIHSKSGFDDILLLGLSLDFLFKPTWFFHLHHFPSICTICCNKFVNIVIIFWLLLLNTIVLNRDFNPQTWQFYVDIPPKFQYINRTFSPCYDLAYDINCVVIMRKPVLSILRPIQSESF